jgi:hypothetical protein
LKLLTQLSQDNPGLSKEEYALAKERTKLEKKYQNDHDGGYTYIDATGVSIPLTPFMMKEWARALVSYYTFLFMLC